MEVGAVAGQELIAGLERGLRPVEEGSRDVLAAFEGHRDIVAVVLTIVSSPWSRLDARSGGSRSLPAGAALLAVIPQEAGAALV